MSLHVEHAGRGPDLVLLHGWGLHSGVWDEAIPRLARRFHVHAIDLPGHGRSAEDACDLDGVADRVAAVIPDGARVCGWSLGGLVAQRMALRHPHKVGALALVSTTPCFVAREDWPHAMKPATLAAFAAGLRADRDATLQTFIRLNALGGARGRDAIRAFTGRIAQRGSPSAVALDTGLDWLARADLRRDAAALAQPTLVLHGARDALAPVEAGRWLASHLRAARLVEIPDAAHLPFFTHLDIFTEALESIVA
jgi:pimeloyl-[acyl-carrier protein] methyl ester esterase